MRKINREKQMENIGLLSFTISTIAVAYYILFVMGGSITW